MVAAKRKAGEEVPESSFESFRTFVKRKTEQIRKEELTRFLKNAKPEEAQKLEEMSRSLMQKILKYPVLHLKAACKRGEAETLSEMLQELFNLEKNPAPASRRPSDDTRL